MILNATAKFTARKDEASEEAILTKDLIITDHQTAKCNSLSLLMAQR